MRHLSTKPRQRVEGYRAKLRIMRELWGAELSLAIRILLSAFRWATALLTSLCRAYRPLPYLQVVCGTTHLNRVETGRHQAIEYTEGNIPAVGSWEKCSEMMTPRRGQSFLAQIISATLGKRNTVHQKWNVDVLLGGGQRGEQRQAFGELYCLCFWVWGNIFTHGRGTRAKWGGGSRSSSPFGSPLQATDPASPPPRHYLGRSCLACLTQLRLKPALWFWSSACCPDLLLGVPIYCLAGSQECEWHSRRRQAEITVMKMTGNLQRWLALWVTGLHFEQKFSAGAKMGPVGSSSMRGAF